MGASIPLTGKFPDTNFISGIYAHILKYAFFVATTSHYNATNSLNTTTNHTASHLISKLLFAYKPFLLINLRQFCCLPWINKLRDYI